MKKIILLIILLFITACTLNNNPTSKTEELLGKYQGLDRSIKYNYTYFTNENNTNKEEYIELIKKQYQNLTYEIKEEKIDGNIATVTTQIEVTDYKKNLDKYKKEEITEKELIDNLNKEKNKVNYTIDFTIKKEKNGNWKLENLNEEQKQKLLGIY